MEAQGIKHGMSMEDIEQGAINKGVVYLREQEVKRRRAVKNYSPWGYSDDNAAIRALNALPIEAKHFNRTVALYREIKGIHWKDMVGL